MNLIEELKLADIDQLIINEIEEDLLFEKNEKILMEYINSSPERESIFKAFEISKKAHSGQTQKGLPHIPYLNHPVQIAIMAFRKNLSPSGIKASLLHDVVEDTPYTYEDLEKEGIEPEVIKLVKDVTRGKDEDRKTYMERVKNLTGESKVIKCFDRYQNLLRAFTLKKVDFLNRYIKETEDIYIPAFERYKELSDLNENFNNILRELIKFRNKLKI
jgi:(p)ppGpp synthase/HD superfamily hydrolase